MTRIVLIVSICCFLCSCNSSIKKPVTQGKILNDTVETNNEDAMIEDSVAFNSVFDRGLNNIMYYNHVITGQKAAKEIVGKFDGVHTDTLFIKRNGNFKYGHGTGVRYFLCSKSGRLPNVELYGCDEMMPLIYEEGDLDGNGRNDVGYLHTWVNSQWRYYRILTFRKGKWFYMFGETEDFLDTPQYFRCSGHEIAKPAKQKGKVCISYMNEDGNEEIKDTIVVPHFTKIVVEN